MPSLSSLLKYSQLNLDEGESEGELEQSRLGGTGKMIKYRHALVVTVLGLIAFAAILLLLLSLCILTIVILSWFLPKLSPSCDIPSQGHTQALQAPTSYKAGTAHLCGHSPSEAKAAGCVFDLMTVSWLPLECYDSELTAQFMEEGPWRFYLSNSTRPEALPEEREQIPSLEAISMTTEKMWTDRRFHIYHCIYGWKMMHRAIERGWKMESSLATYHHTEHCTDTLANTTVPMDAVITRVELDYPAC